MGTKVRHFFSNVISALIWKKTLRDKMRVMIRYPRTFEYKRYVRDYAHKHGICDCGISSRVGRGCGNFVVMLSNKYVFKFPLFSDGREIAERERRITDAFAKISPIKIPKMKIIPYKDIVIRRYEFADGVLVSDVKPDVFRPHREHVAKQIANFILSNKYVFKFPLFSDGREIAERERRITDAFAKISPIKIPKMKIIPYKDIVIRRYEFADGVLVSDVKPDVFRPHREHVAKQIANFIYVIGNSDPVDLRDLKPTPNAKPQYLNGWFHGDIWQNFMLDTKTFDITYFIDWEDTAFQSFMPGLCVATRTWEKRGYAYMGITVLSEYSKLYFQKKKK